MKYPFVTINSQIIRPVIPVTLQVGDKTLPYTGLIDSGADYCIFDKELAKILKIKFNPLDKIEFRGISGKSIGHWATIQLHFGEVFYNQKVVFADLKKAGVGILGQIGFLDHFQVSLDYQHKIITITPNTP